MASKRKLADPVTPPSKRQKVERTQTTPLRRVPILRRMNASQPAGPSVPDEIPLVSKTMKLGRDPKNCQIVLDCTSRKDMRCMISRQHGVIYVDTDSNQWMIRDLKSTNGIFVNGTRVTAPVPLNDEDVVIFGQNKSNSCFMYSFDFPTTNTASTPGGVDQDGDVTMVQANLAEQIQAALAQVKNTFASEQKERDDEEKRRLEEQRRELEEQQKLMAKKQKEMEARLIAKDRQLRAKHAEDAKKLKSLQSSLVAQQKRLSQKNQENATQLQQKQAMLKKTQEAIQAAQMRIAQQKIEIDEEKERARAEQAQKEQQLVEEQRRIAEEQKKIEEEQQKVVAKEKELADAQKKQLEQKEKEAEKMTEETTCVICYDILLKPMSLQCGHTCCNQCIVEWIEAKQKTREGATCPNCRTKITRPLVASVILTNIINDVVLPKASAEDQEEYKERMEEYKKWEESRKPKPKKRAAPKRQRGRNNRQAAVPVRGNRGNRGRSNSRRIIRMRRSPSTSSSDSEDEWTP